MDSRVRAFGRPLLAFAFAWLAFVSVGAQAPAAAARVKATAPPAQGGVGYAGDAACLGCHQDHARGYAESAHGRASNPNAPAAKQGCESCHGPGQAHADGSGDKSKIKSFGKGMTARQVNAQCLACHAAGESAHWEGSQHEARNVSCTTCHAIHAPKSAKALLKGAGEFETCERCHRVQVQKVSRTAHMPVGRGKLGCSSCHNPHGAGNDKLLRRGETVNASCEGCHAEKRGPFLWEHAPVVEDCTTCHDAHGSSNDRMLVAKEPFLCQRCHVTAQHPPSVYDGYALANSTAANRVYGRSCAACHQNIHGSNAPSGQAFLR